MDSGTIISRTDIWGRICNMPGINERMNIYCLYLELRTEEKAILGGRDSIIQCGLKVRQIRQQRQQKTVI